MASSTLEPEETRSHARPSEETGGTVDDSGPITVIEARPGWQFVDFPELWKYRELLFILIWRDVKVRYKQTVLGAAWAILQPLATAVVFTIFFGRLAGMDSGGVPYPLFVLLGIVPWTFFANAIVQGSGSLVASQQLVAKIYFPRLYIPFATVCAGLVDMSVACGIIGVMMAYYGVGLSWTVLMTPLLVLGLVAAAAGMSILLSALTVAYRDFRHIVPFLVQLWMFATPVIYVHIPDSDTPKPAESEQFEAEAASPPKQTAKRGIDLEAWPWLKNAMPLNPAYGLILNFRNAILGRALNYVALGISLCVAGLILVAGCLYFRRVERRFADII